MSGMLLLRPQPRQPCREVPASDVYEELLVNPALVNLTVNRGAIGCGGLELLVIRYGSFFQLVQPIRDGHVSVAIEPSGDPLSIAPQVREALAAARLT